MCISPRSSISSEEHPISQNSGGDEGGSNSVKYLELKNEFKTYAEKIDNSINNVTKIITHILVDKQKKVHTESKSSLLLKSEQTFSKPQIRSIKEVESEMKLKT